MSYASTYNDIDQSHQKSQSRPSTFWHSCCGPP
ncbi:hypothetical protein PDIG_79600 [Penicillium digitatum PHI26]|uniref:Uncharacterized protein n=2 Tax=Penicillium digitatum TaxID=36651 RepID=K9FDC7_PEND2|nr:hypothetical protein PDIP_27980 [Penicillium digitatum Pd1]EKV06182.1 hypothetical protein PDIG_79600 [Penicillium digitatum PHI26]EKV18250.1 hypothetical protein PDIP_27980 [Penicillium digitatum Pd1]